MSPPLDRRDFMQRSAAALALGASALGSLTNVVAAADAAPDAATPDTASANDKLVVGVMGLHRGSALAAALTTIPNAEIAYLCDVDSRAWLNAWSMSARSKSVARKVSSIFARFSTTNRSTPWSSPPRTIGTPRPRFWLVRPASMSMSKNPAAIIRAKANWPSPRRGGTTASCKWAPSGAVGRPSSRRLTNSTPERSGACYMPALVRQPSPVDRQRQAGGRARLARL